MRTRSQRAAAKRLSESFIPANNTVPDFLRGLGEPEQLAILGVDDAFLDQKIEVHGAPPEMLADQNDRYRLDFPGLSQRKDFKQFVERSVATRKSDQRPRPQHEVQLAQGKIMKAEAEIGRDVWIRILLVRQLDVQADGFRPDIECATVGRFHQSRSTACHDHNRGCSGGASGVANQPAEFPRHLVVVAFGHNAFGGRQADRQFGIAGIAAYGSAKRFDVAARGGRLGNARAAENHNRVVDVLVGEDDIGLEIFDFQPRAAYIRPRDEFGIVVGKPVG